MPSFSELAVVFFYVISHTTKYDNLQLTSWCTESDSWYLHGYLHGEQKSLLAVHKDVVSVFCSLHEAVILLIFSL